MNVFQPASMGRGVRLASIASHLPDRVVTNADLVALGAPLSDDEMVRLCGVRERRWVADGQATSDLAIAAARLALARGGLEASQVDRLVVGTVSPDHPSPSCACLVQHALGMGKAPAFEFTASCSGFLYALDAPRAPWRPGIATCSRWRPTSARASSTCTTAPPARFRRRRRGRAALGVPPGAGAARHRARGRRQRRQVRVRPRGGSREPATAATVAAGRHTNPHGGGAAGLPHGNRGHALRGRAATFLAGDDVRRCGPRRPAPAEPAILERMAKLSRLPPEKVFVNIERVGNVSGATCAIALDAALAAGRVRVGDRVLSCRPARATPRAPRCCR